MQPSAIVARSASDKTYTAGGRAKGMTEVPRDDRPVL